MLPAPRLIKGKVGLLGFSDSETDTRFGFHVLVGAEFKAKKVRPFVMLRYDIASDLNQFKIYGGVRFKI